jgi:hypothetical protein
MLSSDGVSVAMLASDMVRSKYTGVGTPVKGAA